MRDNNTIDIIQKAIERKINFDWEEFSNIYYEIEDDTLLEEIDELYDDDVGYSYYSKLTNLYLDNRNYLVLEIDGIPKYSVATNKKKEKIINKLAKIYEYVLQNRGRNIRLYSDIRENELMEYSNVDDDDYLESESNFNNDEASGIMKALNLAYDKLLVSSNDFARSYMRNNLNNRELAIDEMIKWQCGKAAFSGFITNVGGLVTLPVAIPTNMLSVLYFQMKMVQAIATIRGYDLRDDQVRTFIFMTITGNTIKDIIKGSSIMVGNKIALSVVQKIPGRVLAKINKLIGMRLITKAGTTGLLNLTKIVPIVGGIIGGTIDSSYTKKVGKLAKEVFVRKND